MITIQDQLNETITVPSSPQRIISLVPSQTELLFDLGLHDRIVGVTKFCIHPVAARSKAIVGGTKKFNFDLIDRLQPDLIIGNKEENDKEGIFKLKEKFPVWISDIFSLEDALSMIQSVGTLTNTDGKSLEIIDSIKSEFGTLVKLPPLRTLYLIWKKPWMASGQNTFIDCMIGRMGLVNAVSQERYPELTDEDLARISPQLILLSSEPYPFQARHMHELQVRVPNAKIILVDGEMFSWYGSRLIKAPAYFKQLRNQL